MELCTVMSDFHDCRDASCLFLSFFIISGALFGEVSTQRFVSQMLCHGWAHGAPLLAQLLCQAFSVTEWSMLGIAHVGIIDVPTVLCSLLQEKAFCS